MKVAAASTGARSGSLVVVIGVGTHTKMASASASLASVGTTTRSPEFERRTEALIGDVVDRGGPGVQLRHPAGKGVDPFDLVARFDKGDRQRQAGVAEADDCHPSIAGHSWKPSGWSHGADRFAVDPPARTVSQRRRPARGRPEDQRRP